MTYRTAGIPMTLSDLQGHSPTASLFKWDFSYSCAAADKISTDIVAWSVCIVEPLVHYANIIIAHRTVILSVESTFYVVSVSPCSRLLGMTLRDDLLLCVDWDLTQCWLT